MFGIGNLELTKLVFKPEESVRFDMDPRHQTTTIEMTNNEKVDVCVKWKSNRCIYRFDPHFVIVKAKTSQKFTVHCRDAAREYSKPRDRFSAVISAIKPTHLPARDIWKNHSHQEKLFIGKKHKKHIFVIFNNLNLDDWWNREMDGRPCEKRQPTFGLVDDSDEKDPAVLSALLAGNFTLVIVPLEPPEGRDEPNNDGENQN